MYTKIRIIRINKLICTICIIIYYYIRIIGRDANFFVKSRVRVGIGYETRRGVCQDDVQHRGQRQRRKNIFPGLQISLMYIHSQTHVCTHEQCVLVVIDYYNKIQSRVDCIGNLLFKRTLFY